MYPVNNLPLDNHPFACYIYPMNDDLRDMMPTSEEFYANAREEFGEVVTEDSLTPEEQAEYEREYNAYLDQQQE